jgi:large subunit ribosomal protein L18
MRTPKLRYRQARKRRIRARVRGTAARPRLTVYRSLTQITAQIVDDGAGKTLAAASTKDLKAKPNVAGAQKLGTLVAEKAKAAGIAAVVFDRNAYKYHGRVKALADAVRAGGLQF